MALTRYGGDISAVGRAGGDDFAGDPGAEPRSDGCDTRLAQRRRTQHSARAAGDRRTLARRAPPAPVEHARRLPARRGGCLYPARTIGRGRGRRRRLRVGGPGPGAGGDRAVARSPAGVERDRRPGGVHSRARRALGPLPRMRAGRRGSRRRRGRAPSLPALRRTPGFAPAGKPRRRRRLHRRRLHPLSAGEPACRC